MAGNKWFLASGGKGYGPFSSEQLRQMIEAGIVDHDDLVWRDGNTDSIPASAIDSETPPLPAAAEPRPAPPPLPAASTPKASHSSSRVAWLSVTTLLLTVIAGGGWFAYERGWLPLGERLDVADASVVESASANIVSDDEAEESDSPVVNEASDASPTLAEFAPSSSPDLNTAPEESAPETTEPVTLPVPVLYLPCDPLAATIPSNLTLKRKRERYAAGKIGQAVSFDGRSYTELEASLPLGNSPRTLALWVRSDKRAVIGKTPFVVTQTKKFERAKAFGIIDSMNGNWRFQDLNGDLDSGVRIDREWHHIAVTHDGTTTRFYVDGTQVAQANRNLETESRKLRIGGIGGSGNNFVGLIDELYVFDAPLTENQIRQLMDGAGSSSATRESEQTNAVDAAARRPSLHGKVVGGNVALSSMGATVNNEIRNPWAINDGKSPDNWREYAKASLNNPIVVILDAVYQLQSIRVQLVGNEGYRYSVEVSADGKHYEMVQDRRRSGS